MIAACDWNGFILETCQVIERDRDGTVNTEVFTTWLFDNLVPLLGDYSLREPRSIVVLDNASIHHTDEIVELIESSGAIVLYLVPYSPDLNPIELMFNQYKQSLKRHNNLDWWEAHMKDITSVTPSNAKRYFRKCGIPGVRDIEEDSDEEMNVACAIATTIASICCFSIISK
jgi:DDE superfamily endonuclease